MHILTLLLHYRFWIHSLFDMTRTFPSNKQPFQCNEMRHIFYKKLCIDMYVRALTVITGFVNVYLSLAINGNKTNFAYPRYSCERQSLILLRNMLSYDFLRTCYKYIFHYWARGQLKYFICILLSLASQLNLPVTTLLWCGTSNMPTLCWNAVPEYVLSTGYSFFIVTHASQRYVMHDSRVWRPHTDSFIYKI